MSENMIIFEIDTPMKTHDNYYVKVKGFVEAITDLDQSQITSAVASSCRSYLGNIELMQALDLVNPEEAKKLLPGLGDLATSVSKLEISTVDAVEHSTSTIDVEIDPELEGQKQNKGLFGRLKGMFKK